MTLTINVLVALLIALGLSVGLFLVSGLQEASAAKALAAAEATWASVPDALAREAVHAQATQWGRPLTRVFRVFLRRLGGTEQALVRATALRVALAERLVPIGLFLVTLGAIAGFLRRDRARDLVLYSSVTFSYVGKLLTLVAIAYSVFVALSPFAPPLWTLYPAMGVAAFGAATYVGNLPPKL